MKHHLPRSTFTGMQSRDIVITTLVHYRTHPLITLTPSVLPLHCTNNTRQRALWKQLLLLLLRLLLYQPKRHRQQQRSLLSLLLRHAQLVVRFPL